MIEVRKESKIKSSLPAQAGLDYTIDFFRNTVEKFAGGCVVS